MGKIKKIFKGRKPNVIGNFIKNAVMILLQKENDQVNIIFEVRAFNLRSQPGDVCLPGGKVEKGEEIKEAAIRETMEELNLKREDIEFIGSMDYIITPYNFIIYPFISILNSNILEPNKDEVDHIFKIPLDFFIKNKPKLHEITLMSKPDNEFPYHLIRNGKNYKFRTGKVAEYFYEYEEYVIWGFTALIIKSFIDIIR